MDYVTVCSLVFLFTSFKVLADTKCDGKDGVICCFGFTWSEDYKKCIKCRPGYFGINCSKTCPYPNYGEKCKYRCDCSQERCDPSRGCIIKTTLATTLMRNDGYQSTEFRTTPSNLTTISKTFISTRKRKFTKTIYSSTKTGPTNVLLKYYEFLVSTPQSNQNTVDNHRLKSMEAKINLLLKIYEKDRKSHSFHDKLTIGLSILILLSFIFTLVYQFKKRNKSCKYSLPSEKRGCQNSPDEFDHYHKMEDITQLIGGENFTFDGLAEVKFKYDGEKNICTLRFHQQFPKEEQENKMQTNTRYEKRQRHSSYEPQEMTNNRQRLSPDSKVDSDYLENASKYPDQCGYLDSDALQKKEYIDPYLSVVS